MIELFERLSPHERVMSLSAAILHIKTDESATTAPFPPPTPAAAWAPEPEFWPWLRVKTGLIYRTGPYKQHYFIPVESLLPDGAPRPAQTVIKSIALHKTIVFKGEKTTAMFFVYVEEPADRATRPTRSIPPAQLAYMGVEAVEGRRMYRAKSQLHTSRANKRAKNRRQRR